MAPNFVALTFLLAAVHQSTAQNILDVMNGKSVDEVSLGFISARGPFLTSPVGASFDPWGEVVP
jgi:hypothetical protein